MPPREAEARVACSMNFAKKNYGIFYSSSLLMAGVREDKSSCVQKASKLFKNTGDIGST